MTKRHYLFIVLIAFSLFTSGCSQKTISPSQLNTISKIGVLSLHGTKMEAIERGITIFGNEDHVNDISSWEIDDFIQKTLIDNLSKRKLTIVPIKISSKRINSLYIDDGGDGTGFILKALMDLTKDEKKGEKKDENFLKNIMIKNKVDTILLITRGNYVPETHDITRGIAIIKAKTFGLENTTLKLNCYLEGYQLANGELKLLNFNHFRGFTKLENSLWVDTKKTINETNLSKIKPHVEELLTNQITQTMKEAGY